MIDLLEPEPVGPTLPQSITADRWTRVQGWLCPPQLRHLVEQRRDARGRVEWRRRLLILPPPEPPPRVPRPATPSTSRAEPRARRIAREVLESHPEVTARQVAEAAGIAVDTAAYHLRILVSLGVAVALPRGGHGYGPVIYRRATP